MEFFNTSFYDKESGQYSSKRYNKIPTTYTQFFFQERLRQVLSLVGEFMSNKNNQVLIEDGCADGVVAFVVGEKHKKTFSHVIGTDISFGMISEAQRLYPKIPFYIKNQLPSDMKADLILAVGFVSPGIFDDEFTFIQKHLKKDGKIIVSLVNNSSIYARLKLRDKEIFQDYWTFDEYEEFLKKEFKIIDSAPYGLFVPKLWVIPTIAIILQPFFEFIFKPFPSLFHEKLYVLEYKR